MQAQLDEFLTYLLVERGLANNTIASYRRDLTHFIVYLADKNITSWKEVDKYCLHNYMQELENENLLPSSRARKSSRIKELFQIFIFGKADRA